jgi:uroporphyrinogen decarboxylase
VVMVFDTAAGEISPDIYKTYVLPHLKELSEAFPQRLGYYSKGTTMDHVTPHIEKLNWAGLGVDHRFSLPALLKNGVKDLGFRQGNFDQALLFCDESKFKTLLNEYLAPFKELTPNERAPWVCGLGHGVLPLTPTSNVRLFIDTVRKEFS